MKTAAEILHLEDSPIDADLVAELLDRGGIDHRLTCVWTREDFADALERGGFDLILADHSLPAFDGMSALRLARELRPELPFIFVSGTLGEDVAVDALKDGATDYVVKTRMKRLVPAVGRALAERDERRARQDVEGQLDRSRTRLEAALEIARLGTFKWDAAKDRLLVDGRGRDILTFDVSSMAALAGRVERSRREAFSETLARAVREGGRTETDFSLPLANGDVRDVLMICDVDPRDGMAHGVLFDATARRAAERQQELIMRELHHRVKNSLASVQSIINFTLRTSEATG